MTKHLQDLILFNELFIVNKPTCLTLSCIDHFKTEALSAIIVLPLRVCVSIRVDQCRSLSSTHTHPRARAHTHSSCPRIRSVALALSLSLARGWRADAGRSCWICACYSRRLKARRHAGVKRSQISVSSALSSLSAGPSAGAERAACKHKMSTRTPLPTVNERDAENVSQWYNISVCMNIHDYNASVLVCVLVF